MYQIFLYVITIFTILLQVQFAQEIYIDIKELPMVDCSGESSMWNEFNEQETRILVLPDNPSNPERFSQTSFFIKRGFPDSLTKKESELNSDDFNKSLYIYGQINDFNNWSEFRLPIAKTKNGFLLNEVEYTSPGDGVFFITNDRAVFTGNSIEPIWKQQSTVTNYYKYLIFKEGLLDKLVTTRDDIIDIEEVRTTNYLKKSTEYFNLYVDKKIGEMNVDDSFIIDICEKLGLELPDFRINVFAHSNPNATRLFSNFYFMTGCDSLSEEEKFATVQIDGLHITGNNYGFIRHEAFHCLWHKIVGYNLNGNEFLNEGIQKYYEFLTDTSVLSYSLKIQSKYSEYDLTELVTNGNGQVFWSSPKENGYPISYELSGLFVKYLVDNWGLEKFKNYYVSETPDYKKLFGLNKSEMINNYYKWINAFN